MSALSEENKRRFVLRVELESKRRGTFKRPKVRSRRNDMRRYSAVGVVLRRSA